MDIDPIKAARDTIGPAAKSDDELRVTQHAAEFDAKSPELAAILRISRVDLTATDFEEKDQKARDAKDEFNRAFTYSNAAVFLTSIIIVFVLAIGILNPGQKLLLVIFGLLSFVGGSVASYYLNVLKQGKLLEEWMSNRARAESARLEYFTAVAEAASSGNSIELLKLEYFRRFLLDSQLAFYSGESKKHLVAARQALKWSSIAVAGAGTVTALAGFAGGFIHPKFAAVATLGTLFAALSTYVTTREDVYHNQRTAELFTRTEEALREIYKRIDDVRLAVLTDGRPPLLDFIKAVHEQLLVEHKHWLGLETEAENAFAKLQENLNQTLGKLPSGPQRK